MTGEQRDALAWEWMRISSKRVDIESAWLELKQRANLIQFATRRCFIWRLRNDIDSR